MVTATASKARKSAARRSSPADVEVLDAKPLLPPTPVSRLALDSLERHPDNRRPDPAAVEARSASMKALGQLEPLLVRPIAGGRFQIVSGETRFLAARHLGWTHIDARVRNMADAEALQILGGANFQREGLTVIERAEYFRKLTAPVEEGGAGLTQDAAGELANVSRSTVANLIRLLKLPAAVQRLVADGRLPETYVRPLLPLFETPMAKALEKELAKEAKAGDVTARHGRDAFARAVANAAADAGKFPTISRHVSRDEWALRDVVSHKGGGWQQAFALTDAVRESLAAVELPGGRLVALKADEYRAMNLAAAKAALSRRDKKAAGKASAKGSAAAPAKSEAERAQEAAARLEARLGALALDLRGYAASRLIEGDSQLAAAAAVWFLSRAGRVANCFEDKACSALMDDEDAGPEEYAASANGANGIGKLLRLVQRFLYEPGGDGHRPAADVAEHVLVASGRGNTELEAAWDVDRRKDKRHLTAYLAAHDTEPLRRLLQGVRIPAGPAAKKGDLITMGLDEGHLIPLPPSYRLAEPKAKGKKGAAT